MGNISTMRAFNNLLFTLFMILVTSFFASSQEIHLKGVVVDENKKPFDFITIKIFKGGNTIAKSSTTDSLGFFMIQVEPGEYTMELSRLNQVLLKKGVKMKQDLDLGFIIVNQTLALEGVTISARKPILERKIDRLVFNVENSVAAMGGSALDAIRATPGIQVQNEQIAIIGRSSLRVMIDDKIIQLSGESLINFLRSIPSSDIQSIEVITTPPAKYDAEGNSGLINIVYKKTRQNSWSNSVRSSYTQTTYPAVTVGNTFSYNKNKLSLSASLDGKKGSEGGVTTIDLDYPTQLWMGRETNKYRKDNYSGRINTDYKLSNRATIGGIFMYTNSRPDVNTSSLFNIFANGERFNQVNTLGSISEKENNTSLNLNFSQKLDTLGKKLAINIDYFSYGDSKSRFFDTRQTENLYQIVKQFAGLNNGDLDIKNYSAKVDVDHPTKWVNMSYGAKITLNKTNSDVIFYDSTSGVPIMVANQTNQFIYDENIQSVYVDFAKNIGKKWQFKLGFRYELTQTNGESVNESVKNKFSYGRLFPTLHSLFMMDKNNFLNFNYSRRINRPAFWELNPFRWYINANSYSEGNPFLQPSYIDNFELTHGYKQKLFTTFFSQIKRNGFSQLPLIDQQNFQQIFSRKNYFDLFVIGLTENYSINKIKRLQNSLQATGYYSGAKIHPEYDGAVPPQNGFAFSVSSNNSIELNEKGTFIAELNYFYNAPSKGIIYRQSGSSSLDFGLKLLLIDKKLQCGANIYDIFKDSNQTYTTFTSEVRQAFNNYYDNRFVRLSVRYSFGNNKIKTSSKTFGNESERDRIK